VALMAAAQPAELIAAARAIEDALQHAATAYIRYMTAYQAVSRAAYPSVNDQAMLEETIGAARLHGLIVQRLRALGLEPVLRQARRSGTQGQQWVAELSSKIEQFVSE
jgi:hypothetical protein